MDSRPAYRKFSTTAEKWLALAETRREHFRDLYDSGRWRRYYTEDQFLGCLRDVARVCERWSAIVDEMRSRMLPKIASER